MLCTTHAPKTTAVQSKATPAPNFICMTTRVLVIYIRVGGFLTLFT